MKKIQITGLCLTLSIMSGCAAAQTKEADGHYSGCTFVAESGDYYNIGFEIHYSNDDSIEWNYVLEHQLRQALNDLTAETNTPVSLIEEKEYCGDIKRTNTQIQRYAIAVPHDRHDEMIQILTDFSFTLTLDSKISDVIYSSDITLPVIDVETEVQQIIEEAAE